MTEQLEIAIARLRRLTAEQQEEVAALLLTLTGDARAPYRLAGDEREAVLHGLDQAKQGAFVPDDEMAAFWTRHKR